ncbi:MAG: ABC transporter ATP-binding protein [Chitinophagales bacterium]|nr:ABC transporter ATP-binding protein [Chitinophagales bacterium]
MVNEIAVDFNRVCKAFYGLTGKICAINDVTLSIYAGQVVGIVGRNGSGKSTLLKMTAGIMRPTSGTIKVFGDVLAITELGAGFNSDLTGKENIYMAGVIYGLRKKEIDNIFHRVVSFGELGDFIHEPVKNYSQGMFLRLAFALAMHLPAQIVIFDEVLVVGDEAFQHKCFEQLKERYFKNKTVLLTLHDQYNLARISQRCLLMHEGRVVADGEPHFVLHEYHKVLSGVTAESVKDITKHFVYNSDDKDVIIHDVRVVSCSGSESITFADDFRIEIIWEKTATEYTVVFDIECMDYFDRPIWSTANFYGLRHDDFVEIFNYEKLGLIKTTCILPKYLMNVGVYKVYLYVSKYFNKDEGYQCVYTREPFFVTVSENKIIAEQEHWYKTTAPIRTNIFRWHEQFFHESRF